MKKKFLICVILALLLVIPSTAFASGEQNSTRVDAVCNLPEISVTVPATAEIFINPYQLALAIEGTETSAQIISSPAYIENKSKVPISVTVIVDGETQWDSDMRLFSISTKGEEYTGKFVFVYFEMQATSNPTQVNWDSEFNEEKHLIVREGESRPRANMVTIAQADQPEHYGAFRLTGDCVQNPREPWSGSDKLNVRITFTFTPLPRVRD